jgi:sulfite exporter TauE/SafE
VSALFVSMFALGLATSVHCISMCGPMVVTYAVKGEEDEHWTRKITPNLAYQAAKITSYVLVGLVLGTIGSAFNLDALRPWIMFAAGVFMVLIGLGMTGRVPWAARLTPRPPKFLITSLSKLRRKAKADAEVGVSSILTPISFGLLTGLMPCAPLQAAELAAAGTGSALTGGVAMLAFGLGTAPLMLGFGVASSMIPKDWKHRMTVVLAIVVMVFGLVFINRAATLIGSPVTFNTVKAALVGNGAAASTGSYTTASDGVVEVPLAIQNTQYVPSTINIPADKPVRLVVDRQEDVACSNRLVLPQLGVSVPLADNAVTKVDIPPTRAGTYTMTCGMGMMSGTLIVGTAAASGIPGSPILWLTLTLVATASALYAVRRREKTAPTKGAHKSAPAATFLGFTPVQLVLVVGGIAAAAIVGLALGGFFS